jgi:hypothetical protein
VETIQTADLAQAEARLPRWMTGLAVAGTVSALLLGEARFAAGFAVGAALAVMSYFWLHRAIEQLFSARPERISIGMVARFALRYPLVFASVYLFFRTDWLPFVAILTGLFVPVGGVLIEAIIQIGRGWRYDRAPKATGSH